MAEKSRTIVISRNGKTTVITGWRAWLLAVAMSVLVAGVLFVVVFALLGIAVTFTAVALILAPVAIGVGLITSRWRKS